MSNSLPQPYFEQPNGASFHHFQKQSTDTHFQLNQTLSLNKSSILKESYILNISVFFCQIYVNSKLRNCFNLWRCKRLPQISTNFDQLLSHKFWLVYGLSNAQFHKLAGNTMVQSMYWENIYQVSDKNFPSFVKLLERYTFRKATENFFPFYILSSKHLRG